jgi:hypothetical protein
MPAAIVPCMTLVASAVALLLVVGILHEAFEVMLLPRRVPRRVGMVRIFFRLTWSVWSSYAALKHPGPRRETFLAAYGPLSMVLLIVTWAVGLILGFGLLQWAVQAKLPSRPTLANQLYMSGETFFTLGYGDLTPQNRLAKLISVIEAGTGFGFIAVVIGYLPVLYQLYARREIHIMQLDARAGSPPCALTLLGRHAEGDARDELAALLRDWEAWCSELLVSHLSYPMLSYYRSQRDNQSWLAGLAAVIDACAMIMVGLKDIRLFEARMTFSMACLTVVEMSRVFEATPRRDVDRLSRENYRKLEGFLAGYGLVWSDPESAERQLATLRATYEPFLEVLSQYLLLPLPSWLPYEGQPENE